MTSHRLELAGLVALLTLCACDQNGIPKPESVQQAVTLQGFDDCLALEQYLEDRAVLAMRADLTARAESDDDWFFGWGGAPMASKDGAVENFGTPTGTGAQSSPSEFTTTNTQVSGVDEADFVKNDATHILVLSGQTLYVNKSWPADQLATTSRVAIEGWPREMFLDEEHRVVVFSQVYTPYDWASDEYGCNRSASYYAAYCDYQDGNTLKLTVLDLSDDGSPKVLREEYLPGTYLSSRRVGASVRVVTSDPFRWPAGVRFYPDYSEAVVHDKALRVKVYEALMNENETVIRAQTLDQWLPAGKRKLPDGSTVSVPHVCADFKRPTGPTEMGLLTVATLDLSDASSPVTRTSILARADEVYASAGSLYVANQHWWWWPQLGQQTWTYLHKFDLTDPEKAVYKASGAVEGVIVDQFSMDEHQGFLRIATTRSERKPSAEHWWGAWESSSRIAVLAELGGALSLVGTTDDFGKDEQLYSTRFIGDRAYAVTFRQTDPLFTIDLSDPANPRRVGELVVPGYSSYLHPVGATHLLAIGEQDWTVKLSLYDVSDLKQPREVVTVPVGTFPGGSSEAQYEHKAFNYFASKKLLAIPYYSWAAQTYSGDYWTTFVSSLKVFRVDADSAGGGIFEVGDVDMTDVFARGGSGYFGWSWYWNPGVRRSVMADDFVYAVSDGGIRSANAAALASPLKTILFDEPTFE